MSAVPKKPLRTRMIAAIHAEVKSRDLDDDTYRLMLLRVSATCGNPQRSAADMTDRQLAAVLEDLRRVSFDPLADRPNTLAERPLLRKIGALLTTGRKPWAYAHALAKRMGGGDRLEFCTDDLLRKVVAALSIDSRRKISGSSTRRGKK